MTDSCQTLNKYVDTPASVLLLAPAHDASDDRACTDLLTREPLTETNVLSVTLSASPAERLSMWQREVGDELPTRAAFVDASSSRTEPSELPPEISVNVLPDDADYVDLGVAISRQLGAWEDTDETSQLCLHSLSSVLDAYDTDRAISLINALNDLCTELGVVVHHHLDPTAHDEETVASLRPLYDTVLEHTPEGGWIPFQPDDTSTAPTFRSTTAPPGGTAKTDPERPETVPMPQSFDTLLELLSEPRRRTLLYALKDHPSQGVPLDELAERIHEREQAIPVREADPFDRIRIDLVHVHLPKLEEIGILEYDDETKTVLYDANLGLESFLRYVETLELG